MSQLTIAEVHSLHPNTVIPQHLINIEKKRITYARTRTKEVDDEDNFIDSSFDLKEFHHFNELLKTKTNSAFIKKIESTKRELNQYIKSKKSEAHGILIAKYIVHLLSSVDKENKDRHIAISTFRNYYSLIKTHLFSNVEDLTNVQTHEINKILQNLAISRYSDKRANGKYGGLFHPVFQIIYNQFFLHFNTNTSMNFHQHFHRRKESTI